jgi:hypothetical protein
MAAIVGMGQAVVNGQLAGFSDLRRSAPPAASARRRARDTGRLVPSSRAGTRIGCARRGRIRRSIAIDASRRRGEVALASITV